MHWFEVGTAGAGVDTYVCADVGRVGLLLRVREAVKDSRVLHAKPTATWSSWPA